VKAGVMLFAQSGDEAILVPVPLTPYQGDSSEIVTKAGKITFEVQLGCAAP